MNYLNEDVSWRFFGSTGCGARIWVPGLPGRTMPRPKGGPCPEILYFNDSHGGLSRVLPFMAGKIDSLKAARREWIALAGGDDHGGGALTDLSVTGRRGYSAAWEQMKAAGVDAAVPGNHDIDWGWETYFRMSRRQNLFPRVLSHFCAELDPDCAHFPVLLVEFDHHLMGILGMLCMDQTREGERFLKDPAEIIPQRVRGLRERVDSLVLLSHLGRRSRSEGFSDNDLLQSAGPGVLVLGAHTHDTEPEPGAARAGSYLQSGQKGAYLGRAVWQASSGVWRLWNEPTPDPPQKGEAAEREGKETCIEIPVSFAACTRPEVDGYTGQCPVINAATDVLHSAMKGSRATLCGLCVRFFSSHVPDGRCSRADWYRIFPYADCLATIRFPLSRLPALLEANARRLLLPPCYLEERGMLHFSRNLSYRVERGSAGFGVTDIQLDGTPVTPDVDDGMVTLLTQGYVAEGMGGYANVFHEAGLAWKRSEVAYIGDSVRDLLWRALETRSLPQRTRLFRRDERLKIRRGPRDPRRGEPSG